MGGDHGHGHGHGHGPKIVIPDYTSYKVEECPQLVALRDKLAKKGLKDPWLRNEVWRFHPKQFGGATVMSNIVTFFGRGFKYGFAAFLVTIAVDKFLFSNKGHGHDEHKEGTVAEH